MKRRLIYLSSLTLTVAVNLFQACVGGRRREQGAVGVRKSGQEKATVDSKGKKNQMANIKIALSLSHLLTVLLSTWSMFSILVG